MASAVLPSRNESCCGEGQVYMRKYLNSTSNPHLSRFNPNPNPSPNFFLYQNPNPYPNPHLSRAHLNEPSPIPRSAPPPAVTDPVNRRLVVDLKESSQGGYVTYHLNSYTRRDLKELKKRLICELQDVRRFRCQIEAREQVYRSSSYVSLGSSVSDLNLKKNKKILGQKRAMPSSAGRNVKRPVLMDKRMMSMMKKCGQMLMKLMTHKHGWVFKCPVDAVALGLTDYHQIIKNPMDLGTVKAKLDKNEYGSPLEFASDVRLTFKNAMTYNEKGEDVHAMANTLLSSFDKMFNPANKKFEADNQKVCAKEADLVPWQPTLLNPRPVQALVNLEPDVTPGPIVNMSKPKAKDPNKRLMSYAEKASLGARLQNLPPEKMDQIIKITRKKYVNPGNEGEELELDICALDNEILWELDRFVSCYQKKAAKRDGGHIDNSVLVSVVEINKQSPISEQRNKKLDVVEEDVDIGEEIPISNFPPVEIERSSSSSGSSSSSDSSSSDSDSGSSSGSDSDEDSVKSPFVESTEAPVA
ncbi:hypothetical protein LguiA_014200 [Lonicera macranthoides]